MSTEGDELDGKTYFRLKTLIETLTHSGLRVLDEKLFKEIKKICRTSPSATEKTYSVILYQLKKNHSEIRHLAFQMCIELFKRSALFRELIVKDLNLIIELTAGTNPKKKMPQPKAVAKILERLALSTIKKWNDEFGIAFKQLKLAFNYLKHLKKVNFETMTANEETVQQQQRHERAVNEERMEKLLQEINSNESEIENAITALINCMSLLVPSPDDFFISDGYKEDVNGANIDGAKSDFVEVNHDKLGDDKSHEINLKHFGITSNYGILVETSAMVNKIEVKKTDENSPVIQNAEDNVKLIKNRFLPLIKKWSQTCVKYSTDNGAVLQRILKLKEKMENCVKKYKELNIQSSLGTESDSSCDDFEEVTKEHYEPSAIQTEDFDFPSSSGVSMKKPESDWQISVGEYGDPASALSTLKRLQGEDDTKNDHAEISSDKVGNLEVTSTKVSQTVDKEMSRKEKLLACAPKLPFDVDLYHWEDQNLKAPTLLSIKLDNPKFWGTTSVDDMDEIPNPEGVAALRTRVIEFSGKFEPVKWSCRTPLPNGKLCPRKDRFKCPFHGKIVPRDENGVCQDTPSTSDNCKRKRECDWQDPELLEDIKNATGVDLTITKNGRSSKKKKISKTNKIMKTSSESLKEIEKRNFPGLTDTIGKQNTAYKRISRKIFKRSALNKVAATLDKIDFAKHRDKFGDQFNYVYGT